MSEIDRIVDQLKRSWGGDAWHGPSLSELLADVDAAKAAAHPVAGAHSIWELALHVATWDRTVANRLKEWNGRDPSEVKDTTEAAWKSARETLASAHRELEEAVSSWPEDHLGETVPDKPYSVYVMLHGAAQHELYHGGQIALLKKA